VFVDKLREASAIQQEESAKAAKKKLTANERRIAELDRLFKKTYEDNASGKLSDKRFEQLTADYELEQSDLEAQNAELQAQIDAYAEDSVKADRFIELVRRYVEFEELTAPMLHEFVDKVYVSEADKSNGERRQEVEIYFNFIGRFEPPKDEAPLTSEELAEKERKREKRAKQREANRRWCAKKRSEHLARIAK
jgi:hypothetical protein